jgi:hypothetical protein
MTTKLSLRRILPKNLVANARAEYGTTGAGAMEGIQI